MSFFFKNHTKFKPNGIVWFTIKIDQMRMGKLDSILKMKILPN